MDKLVSKGIHICQGQMRTKTMSTIMKLHNDASTKTQESLGEISKEV